MMQSSQAPNTFTTFLEVLPVETGESKNGTTRRNAGQDIAEVNRQDERAVFHVFFCCCFFQFDLMLLKQAHWDSQIGDRCVREIGFSL